MKRNTIWLVSLFVALVIGAGCSGGDQEDDAATAELDGDTVEADDTDAADDAEDATAGTLVVGGDESGAESGSTDDGGSSSADGSSDDGSQSDVGAPIDDLEGAELEEYVARQYEAFWLAFDQARGNPTANPEVDHTDLARYADGEMLDAAYAELKDMASFEVALREPESPAVPGIDHEQSHRIRVDRLEDGLAELSTCLVNDLVRYNVADGSVAESTVRSVAGKATMVRTDGTWKVIRARAVGFEDGVGGCWLEDEGLYPW